MSYELQKKPWKIWMSSAPDPTAVLVSAYDLIQGVSLGHDIIIYNGNVYSNGIFVGSSFDDFYRYEIDISPAIFDRRAKFKVQKVKGLDPTLTGIKNENENEIDVYCYDKDAALYPEDIKTFYAVDSKWKDFFRHASNLSDYNLETGYKSSDFMTATAINSDDFSEVPSTTSIILYEKDQIFSSTMTFEDGKEAYNKVKLNLESTQVHQLIAGCLLYNSNSKFKGFDTIDKTLFTNAFTDIYEKYEDLLKNIYFWFKAPFCADYIDPTDFNQNLNQDSDVVHRNLLLANSYDSIRNNFNRYNESFIFDKANPTLEEYFEKMSRPYTPVNSPLKDFLSKEIVKIVGADIDNVESAAKRLIENSYEDDQIIGSVLTSPGSVQTHVEADVERFTPFNFYDPESREDVDYYTSLKRIPTIIGKDGNITTDGRIMSPSIDEIWYIIKKIISGQIAAGVERNLNISSPKNKSAKDTTLTEAVTSQYHYKNIDLDPIDFEYLFDDDGNVNGINVKEFVVQPETIVHNVYNLIKTVSKRINKFYELQNEVDSELTEDLSGNTVYTGNSKDITRTGEDIIIGTSTMDKKSTPDNEYGNRKSAPMSLRELEAAILGNKYNIENNFMFISKVYAVTGKFGKLEKDSNENIVSAGSLYQLHRDYNGEVENPNTYFKYGGDNNTGYDAEFGDLKGKQEINGAIPVYLLDKNNKRTSNINTSKMPMLVNNYGKSELLYKEHYKYSGADIYLAADGTWRYKMEHIRIPILRSRY